MLLDAAPLNTEELSMTAPPLASTAPPLTLLSDASPKVRDRPSPSRKDGNPQTRPCHLTPSNLTLTSLAPSSLLPPLF